jgi:hypothetical protein
VKTILLSSYEASLESNSLPKSNLYEIVVEALLRRCEDPAEQGSVTHLRNATFMFEP